MNNYPLVGYNTPEATCHNLMTSISIEYEATCSKHSIISDFDTFFKAVSNMVSTVLLPSRLMSLDVHNETKSPINDTMPNIPPLTFFSMVKELKNELIWRPLLNQIDISVVNWSSSTKSKWINRAQQLSNESLLSIWSDQDTDSGIIRSETTEDSDDPLSNRLIILFHHHLQGLQAIVNQLTESTDYLTSWYQYSIDFEPVQKVNSTLPIKEKFKMISFSKHLFQTFGYKKMNSTVTNTRTNRPSKCELTCSKYSIISDIDKFIRAVSNMVSTVLMPTKLQDLDIETKLPINATMPDTDPLTFFSTVKDVKNELIWSRISDQKSTPTVSNSASAELTKMKSEDSLGSAKSDQDTDSGIGSISTDHSDDSSHNHLTIIFRHHLHGLQVIINQLTETTHHLTSKYQDSIDALSRKNLIRL